MANASTLTAKALLSLLIAAAFIGTTLRYNQKQHDGLISSRPQKALRGKQVNDNNSQQRHLQYLVQGGGGGSAELYYGAGVVADADTDAYSASSGSGEVSGGGVASIKGPDGSAMAGGRGGGSIKGAFGIYAFNEASGYVVGGGKVAGYGGGTGQYFKGKDAGKSKDKAMDETFGEGFIYDIKDKEGSTGGNSGAIAYAKGAGFGNLTALVDGSFADGNATGMTEAFGFGYGQGANSEGTAGGTSDVRAFGNGGGSGTAGTAPDADGTANGMGGMVTFNGVAYGASSATGGGAIGGAYIADQALDTYYPTFELPSFTGRGFGLISTQTAP